MPSHTTILHTAATEKMDVVCIQEPWTYPGSKTQSHPGYDCYAPIDSWDSEDPDQREAERPRVMTYVRKGAGLKTQQRRPIHSRDMLWLDVNGYAILNVYQQPLQPEVIDYVTYLSPPTKCLVGGDFNAWHDMFEPGVQAAHQGAELARWATESGMDFIGTPGAPTQRAGHVLDLTFSNVSFAQTTIRTDMHSGSDHETQVTIIPGRGNVPLEQFHFRVPESELDKFAGLVKNSVANLINPWHLTDTTQIDKYAITLAEIFNSAIQTVGRPDRCGGNKAPWWSAECENAYRDHLIARQNILDNSTSLDTSTPLDNNTLLETREFLSTVRKAKREYWRHIINGVSDDKSLYKVIG